MPTLSQSQPPPPTSTTNTTPSTPSPTTLPPPPSVGPYTPTLILHGGAGAITRSTLPPPLHAEYVHSLRTYLLSTSTLLSTGSTALTAACHAVCLLEDDPLFNCGRGSVFTLQGEIEMEASVAVSARGAGEGEGQTKKSAAVSMLRSTRHPVLLARAVLDVGDESGGGGRVSDMHGHLSGRGVEEWGFAERGLERMGPEWFWTRRRWEEHLRGLSPENSSQCLCPLQCDGLCADEVGEENATDALHGLGLDEVHVLPSQGTVGAVCMDSWGNIAVATSTGGLTNKLSGRIGDTPTVGAGFWAENWEEERSALSVAEEGGRTTREMMVELAREGVRFWIGDCFAGADLGRYSAGKVGMSIPASDKQGQVEKQPLLRTEDMTASSGVKSRRRAIAMSGTGNGDSFLRTNACRTAAAIARFSSLSLQEALHAVAGPNGELQKSAGDRWGKTGEGEGGIIGIELVENENNKEGKAVFDFNCGGLWRAYLEKDADGKEKPKVMVFRDEY